MNTKAIHPRKSIAIATILVLITAVFIASCADNQPAVVTESSTASPYSDALELQYAQPWLDAQDKPTVEYGNALEMQYSQPWLEEAGLMIAVTGGENPLDCHSSLEMLYACQNGYGLP